MSARFIVDQGKDGLCALLSRAMTVERFASVLLRPLQPITSPSVPLVDAASIEPVPSVNTQSAGVQPPETQSSHPQGVDAQPLAAQPLAAQSLVAQLADFQSAGSQSLEAELTDTHPADTHPADTHPADAFVTTPFNVLASRRVTLRPSKSEQAYLSWPETISSNWPGLSAQAYALLAVLTDQMPGVTISDVGIWIEELPPLEGFVFVEEVPVTVVRRLADQGRQLAREFSGPAGPPASLLNRTVLTASRDGLTVEVPMRVIFACTALGLLPEFGASLDIPRQLRISKAPGWLRVDAPYGTLWYSLLGDFAF